MPSPQDRRHPGRTPARSPVGVDTDVQQGDGAMGSSHRPPSASDPGHRVRPRPLPPPGKPKSDAERPTGRPQPDPRVAETKALLVALKDQVREARKRAEQAEHLLDVSGPPPEAGVGQVLMAAGRQAAMIVAQARARAARRLTEAEANLAAVRAEGRYLLEEVRVAVVAALDAEDRAVAAARAAARSQLLDRLDELARELAQRGLSKAGPGEPQPPADAPSIAEHPLAPQPEPCPPVPSPGPSAGPPNPGLPAGNHPEPPPAPPPAASVVNQVTPAPRPKAPPGWSSRPTADAPSPPPAPTVSAVRASAQVAAPVGVRQSQTSRSCASPQRMQGSSPAVGSSEQAVGPPAPVPAPAPLGLRTVPAPTAPKAPSPAAPRPRPVDPSEIVTAPQRLVPPGPSKPHRPDPSVPDRSVEAGPTVASPIEAPAPSSGGPFGPLSLEAPKPLAVDALTEPVQAIPRARRSTPLRWQRAAAWVRNLGVLLLLFCAYVVWGTGFAQARDQARLKDSFTKAVAAREASTPEPSRSQTEPPPQATGQGDSAGVPGGAVALMRIPSIDLTQAVVEGTSAGDLRKGPGRYSTSPMPGETGNVAIAGHRTTYGAPFRQLDDLRVGDAIVVTTARGEFRYTVSEPTRVVDPGDRAVLADHGDNRLTLTTCNPKYQASERLVVVARPDEPQAEAPSAPPPAGVAPAVEESAAGIALHGEARAWLPSMLWAGLLGLVWLGFGRLRRGTPILAVMVTAPAGLVTLLTLFGSLSRILPAGL